MTVEFVLYWSQQAVQTVMLVTAPILLGGMLVGLILGIFQSVTSINEMTLTFIPKIAVVIVIILYLMPWILSTLTAFTANVFSQISVISQ